MTWLLAVILLPLLGGVVTTAFRHDDRLATRVAFGFALATLLLVIPLWIVYDPGGARLQQATSMGWIPAFGAHIAFGAEGIALRMIPTIAMLVPIGLAALP